MVIRIGIYIYLEGIEWWREYMSILIKLAHTYKRARRKKTVPKKMTNF